jgi:hypothetical protein
LSAKRVTVHAKGGKPAGHVIASFHLMTFSSATTELEVVKTASVAIIININLFLNIIYLLYLNLTINKHSRIKNRKPRESSCHLI